MPDRLTLGHLLSRTLEQTETFASTGRITLVLELQHVGQRIRPGTARKTCLSGGCIVLRSIPRSQPRFDIPVPFVSDEVPAIVHVFDEDLFVLGVGRQRMSSVYQPLFRLTHRCVQDELFGAHVDFFELEFCLVDPVLVNHGPPVFFVLFGFGEHESLEARP